MIKKLSSSDRIIPRLVGPPVRLTERFIAPRPPGTLGPDDDGQTFGAASWINADSLTKSKTVGADTW